MSESFLVHYILNTPPKQYGSFKISYNMHNDKWSINKLRTMCLQEEGRLIMELGESAFLANQEKNKDQAKEKGKDKVPPQADIKKESKCFFCKKKGRINCVKFQKWLEKKVNSISCVYYESNMVEVSHNTWWIDFGSTIYISNSLQDMQNLRKSVRSEQCIYSRNKMRSHVEGIGTCNLILSSGFVLELEKIFLHFQFFQEFLVFLGINLISVLRLVPSRYSFQFSDIF